MKWSEVAQSCPTLCDPMDCSLPGSSLHGILQARVLEWVAIPFSRGSSWPRDRTRVSLIAGRCFNLWATREALLIHLPFLSYVKFLDIYASASKVSIQPHCCSWLFLHQHFLLPYHGSMSSYLPRNTLLFSLLLKTWLGGTSLAVRWWRFHTSNAQGKCSIPG